MTTGPSSKTPETVGSKLLKQHWAEQFLFKEARLIDQRQFTAWEDLWDETGAYWVPANGDASDPERDVSLIYDNRARLHTRIERYVHEFAHSQNPPPRTCRVISNIELDLQPDLWVVNSTFHLTESRTGVQIEWAGRTLHHLVERDQQLLIQFKKVLLVNNDQELTTLDFLL